MAVRQAFFENKKGDIIRYLLLHDKGNASFLNSGYTPFFLFSLTSNNIHLILEMKTH